MGPRHLSRALSAGLALLCALAPDGAGAPQNAPPTSAAQVRHRAAVRTERSARFFAADAAAPAGARGAAEELLRAAGARQGEQPQARAQRAGYVARTHALQASSNAIRFHPKISCMASRVSTLARRRHRSWFSLAASLAMRKST